MLNPSHKVNRDLLTGMDYVRDNSLVTQREYNYDALGRPMTRDTRYPNKAIHHADAFTYNKRSESAPPARFACALYGAVGRFDSPRSARIIFKS